MHTGESRQSFFSPPHGLHQSYSFVLLQARHACVGKGVFLRQKPDLFISWNESVFAVERCDLRYAKGRRICVGAFETLYIYMEKDGVSMLQKSVIKAQSLITAGRVCVRPVNKAGVFA